MKELFRIVLTVLILAFGGCGSSRAPAQTANGGSAQKEPDRQATESDSSTGSDKKGTANATAAASPKVSPSTSEDPKQPPPGTAKTSKVHEISFDDLNCGMQADIQFRDWMLTDRVKELKDQRVQISGYILPDVKQKGITEFLLLRNTECKFGPTGQADHLIQVKLNQGVTTNYSIGPVQVVGVLKVNPYTGPDGNTWSIFDMQGESVRAFKR